MRPKGFSLIETIVTMSMFFIILFGVYIMIVHYGNATKTEHARMTIQQQNRFIGSVFSEELKDAGAVLTLGHTGGFLSETPYFNGIYPLNSGDFPDGIIIATGDPEAVTFLASDHSSGNTSLNVKSATVPATAEDSVEYPAWSQGDKGILLSKDGYYVFYVENADESTNTITIRDWAQPVYFSGQLQSTDYYDTASGTSGSALDYPKGSMVVRLSNFGIYLFKRAKESKTNRDIRQLVRVNDTKGEVDVLSDASSADKSVISENIWDMQISYIAYDKFAEADRNTTLDPAHHYFAGGSTSQDQDALLQDLRERKLKQIDIAIVTLTDQFGGIGASDLTLPQIGDRYTADTLPDGKYGIKITYFTVEPRNFNIIL